MSIANWILVWAAIISAVLFLLKTAQVGLAANWSWWNIFAPMAAAVVFVDIIDIIDTMVRARARHRDRRGW